jgi:hypothetical protein
MPVGEEILHKMGRKPTQIVGDLYCRKCEYNVKGVRDGICPECGTPIQIPGRRRFGDTMTDAPMGYLKTTAAACVTAALCALGATLALLVVVFAGQILAVGVAALLSIGWALAISIVVRPRETTRASTTELAAEWRRVRLINRITPWLWVLGSAGIGVMVWMLNAAFAAAAATGLPPSFSPALYATSIATSVVLLCASLGLVPLCVQLADLADWGQNTGLSDRFRVCAWCLVFGAIAVPLASLMDGRLGRLQFLLSVVKVLGGMALVFGVPLFLIGLVQLANMCTWAVSNSASAMERDRRLAERVKLAEMESLQRAYAVPPPVDPYVDLGIAGRGSKVDKSDGTTPYEIEPESRGSSSNG